MAEGDRQLAFTTGPLPVSVQVSGADKLTPKAVNASFDGTSAAGAFLPCLIITGRTGHEVARIPAPQVAAGASAEVSWFPRVGGASAAAPVTVTAREILQTASLVTVAAAGTGSLTWAKVSGTSLLDLTDPANPTFVKAGVYAVTLTAQLFTLMTVGATYRLQLAMFGSDFANAVLDSPPATAAVPQPFVALTLVHFWHAGQVVNATVANHDSIPLDFGIFQANVQQIS